VSTARDGVGTGDLVSYVDRYVTTSELRLHYVDYGGTGQSVVALHGLVQNAHAFDSIAQLMVPHMHLFALDLRGRGGSDWGAPERYTWACYLRDSHEFLGAVGLSRCTLIGTSMGGTLAMLYGMAHPAALTGLVMNDASLNANRAGVIRATQRCARAPSTFQTVSEAMTWFLQERDGLDRIDESQRLAWVRHFLVPAWGGGWRFDCDPAIIRRAGLIPPTLGPRVPWSHRWSVWQQVKRLRMPVLVLRGEKSDVVPRSSVELMAEVLPSARWREISGVGHAPTLYEPESQAALAEFFNLPGRQGCA
jgi:pimeloyl-ACP methyl ester carboxylesterase